MNFNCNHVGSTGGKTIVCLWQGQRRQLAYICHLRHLFEYTIKTNYYFRIAACAVTLRMQDGIMSPLVSRVCEYPLCHAI